MPRGHGRIGSNVEKVAGRRNHSLRRRSLDESNYKLISEERRISGLILGNTEQRCIIFTLADPEPDAYCKLVTILQALQSPEQRNHSTAPSESPSTIIFLVNPQKEHSTVLSENTCSSESSSPCSSSGINIMGQSHNRNKRTKSLKVSSNSSGPRCLTADTSSGSLCDSLSPPSSDDLVSDISKVEQPRKRSSKKKGKKKGKHYKRSIAEEDSTELGHCEGSTCSTPVAETSTGCPPACLRKQISEKSSEKLSFSLTSVVENITAEKVDSETNNQADSSTTMMSCMSDNDEMEESEAVDSQSQGFAHEKLTSHSLRELKSTSSSTKSTERVPSTVYVNIKSASPNQSINYNDNSSCISMDLCDDAVAGSFQDHWKSNANGNCSNDVETRLPIKDKEGLDISGEVDSDPRKFEVNSDSWKYDPSFHRTTGDSLVMNNEVSNDYCTSGSYWSEGGVVHADSCTERAQCSSEACNSNDFHPVLSGKGGRAARKSSARTGKDNHPVWQKVQKMENRRCINKPMNVDAVSPEADNPSKDSSARARVNTSSGLNQTGKHLYSYETVSETSKSSEINTTKKHSSISKRVNHHLRKGSHNGTVNPGQPSKILVQQKEGLKILPQVNHDEHTSSQLSFPSRTDFPIPVVKSNEKFDLCPSVQQQKTKEHINEESLSGNTGSMAGEMTSSVACKQIGQSLSTLDPLGHSHKIDIDGHADNNYFQVCENMQDDLCLMDIMDNQYKKLQAECSRAEYSEPDNNSGPVLQKWVPMGRKYAAVSQIAHIENLTASVIDDSISNVLDSKNAEIEVGSEAQSIVRLTGQEMQGSSRSGDDADCSSSETDILSDKLVSCSHADGGCVVHNELNLQLSQEDQQFVKFETDLDKIMHAANDAYKLRTTAGVSLLAGSPLAEVERFMCSASPVISRRNRICTTCSGGQQNSNSLCVDQIYNLSLASLWRWYEEPGCYGLEVKAEENLKSKRLCDGFVEFRAYFVPYLSAMQLFRQSDSSYASSSGVMTESSEVDKASRSSSNLASLPIFSTLLPRPRAEADACLLKSTSSATNEFCSQSAKETNLFDEELIFEYFEHAQPPQRRPLFDKIKELINGDRSSNCQIYGDPSKLECSSLHDLHPASWYAVAWYPIYRIPEGNFRAAFLTYHSLGHFIHQSASSNMAGDFTCITSPVVGLQSYNAKKECWFQPRDLIEPQKEESSVSPPSKVLEERLKTLERSASVMATATVRKGNQRSVNNHPDYNHFSSRW